MRSLFIDPGLLRTEFALEAFTPQDDGLGGHQEIWTEVGTVFARIEPVDARSVFGAGQSLETVTHRVTMRYRDGVISGMRFTRSGRIFDIVTAYDPDETQRYLVCRVKEAAGA